MRELERYLLSMAATCDQLDPVTPAAKHAALSLEARGYLTRISGTERYTVTRKGLERTRDRSWQTGKAPT